MSRPRSSPVQLMTPRHDHRYRAFSIADAWFDRWDSNDIMFPAQWGIPTNFSAPSTTRSAASRSSVTPVWNACQQTAIAESCPADAQHCVMQYRTTKWRACHAQPRPPSSRTLEVALFHWKWRCFKSCEVLGSHPQSRTLYTQDQILTPCSVHESLMPLRTRSRFEALHANLGSLEPLSGLQHREGESSYGTSTEATSPTPVYGEPGTVDSTPAQTQ